MGGLDTLLDPKHIGTLAMTVTRGVTAGWVAGIPQVLVAQIEGQLLGVRERADIGPRFVRQAALHAGAPLSTPMHWLLGAVFHFEYAAGWGALYAVLAERVDSRRVPPLLGAALLAGAIYAAAFSPLGAATRTGAEREPGRRQRHETLLHWTAASTFALTNAFTYRWLRARW